MDLRNTPQDTCPLCRQQTLTISDNLLRCSTCQSVAELDPVSHRVKYVTVAPPYHEFEAPLKQDWLSRRQIFDLTTKPLPVAVFIPVILSLLALCILLGVVGAILAIRPSLVSTRELIEAAYGPTATITGTGVLTEAAVGDSSPLATIELTTTLTPEGDIIDGRPRQTATVQLQIETMTPQAVLVTATPSAQPAHTPTVSTLRTTSTSLPPTNTAVPTAATRVITLTPAIISPIGTPSPAPGAAGATLTPTPPLGVTSTPITATTTPQAGAATLTATPATPATATATVNPLTPSPAPTETVVFSGTAPSGLTSRSVLLTNAIAIADIKVKGEASFNEGDEYIDLKNTSNELVTMNHWKIRVNFGPTYFIPNEAASLNFAIPAGQGCRILTGSVNTQNAPPPFNWCGTQSFGALASSIGIYTNDHGTVEILDDTGKTVASLVY